MDFDNTLYDWFYMWHTSFRSMLDEIVRISNIDEPTLVKEIRFIHQKHRTSEYAFLIQEIPSLIEKFGKENLVTIFNPAIHAYRKARKDSLSLYPTVMDTLVQLKNDNVTLVIYTESLAYYTHDRIVKLGLDDIIDYVYSPTDHAIPHGVESKLLKAPLLKHASHRFTPAGVTKPNPDILLGIISEINCSPVASYYIGDSIMKDISMAKDANIISILAKYGAVQTHTGYELLRKVSHWPDKDVQQEKLISTVDAEPTYAIDTFRQILPILDK